MILKRFNPLIALFDAFERFWEASYSQRRLAGIFFWVYLLALALIQARRAGLMPAALAAITPSSHFAAIQLAFTLILAVEVLELIMSIPSSFSRSVGKQFEILALILLRDAFKQLSHLPEPVDISTNLTPLFHIACSAAGALVVFIALGFYFKIVRRISYSSAAPRENQTGYITRKKLLALVLLGIFAGTAINDTSSVTAAASTWDSLHGLGSQTLDKAVTVKLTRTLAIIPITLVLAFVRTKRAKTDGTKVDLKKIFPMFILYFLLASVVTTICVSAGVSASVFTPLKTLSKFLIVMAMCAVGLNTNIVKLVKTGGKPLIMGFCCWVGIAGMSLLMQHVLGIW